MTRREFAAAIAAAGLIPSKPAQAAPFEVHFRRQPFRSAAETCRTGD